MWEIIVSLHQFNVECTIYCLFFRYKFFPNRFFFIEKNMVLFWIFANEIQSLRDDFPVHCTIWRLISGSTEAFTIYQTQVSVEVLPNLQQNLIFTTCSMKTDRNMMYVVEFCPETYSSLIFAWAKPVLIKLLTIKFWFIFGLITCSVYDLCSAVASIWKLNC